MVNILHQRLSSITQERGWPLVFPLFFCTVIRSYYCVSSLCLKLLNEGMETVLLWNLDVISENACYFKSMFKFISLSLLKPSLWFMELQIWVYCLVLSQYLFCILEAICFQHPYFGWVSGCVLPHISFTLLASIYHVAPFLSFVVVVLCYPHQGFSA